MDNRFEMQEDRGYLVLSQWNDGHAGSKYDHMTTEIKGRRVEAPDRNEVQLEVCIRKIKGGRVYEDFGGIQIPVEAIPALIEMLQGKLNK